MKNFCKIVPFCFLSLCLSLCGCLSPDLNGESSTKENVEYSKLLPYDNFYLDTYMQPIWLGDTVYNETVSFIGNNGEERLLYPVEEIISVTSYDLKTTYKEGVDYLFDAKTNALKLTDNTSMPFFFWRGYYPLTEGQFHSYSQGTTIFFSEGPTFSKKHSVVTYRANKNNLITPPTDQSEYYPKFLNKLKNNQPTKICFYGDSITVGGNGSGFLGIEPHMPGFPVLVTESLKKLYKNDQIVLANHAKGGETSAWGIKNINLVIDENPDLVVLCWGMNDNSLGSHMFANQIKEMIEDIKASCPNAEILLVSSMLPNGDVKEFRIFNDYKNCNMMRLELAQEGVAAEYGLGIAKMTTMHKEILTQKSYVSMSGNNVNHPTDFLIRLYAQNILFTLTGKTI